MMKLAQRVIVGLFLLPLLAVTGALAQGTPVAAAPNLPPTFQLKGFTHIWQGWNNCGPATITEALSYFGGTKDQYVAAAWLKPNKEDKNVSPWQLAEYVNTQVGGTARALVRQGGTLTLLKSLLTSNFPVVIESGYDPPGENLGWMGHYLLVTGYDDSQQIVYTYDTYKGPNFIYSYDHLNTYWRHFDRLFVVLYDQTREAELKTLLGADADERQNSINALEVARQEAVGNPQDPFAWFNMGTNFIALKMYNEAATAFDQARNVGGGLPWRMMWYQFGPFEAYYHTGRFQDMIALAQANLKDGGGQYVEETFYYAGLAREGLGEKDKAVDNFDSAIAFNPNFQPARDALAQVQAS